MVSLDTELFLFKAQLCFFNQIKNNIKESSTIRIKKGEDLGFTFGEKDYFLPAENNTQDASEKVIVISLPKQNE